MSVEFLSVQTKTAVATTTLMKTMMTAINMVNVSVKKFYLSLLFSKHI